MLEMLLLKWETMREKKVFTSQLKETSPTSTAFNFSQPTRDKQESSQRKNNSEKKK